MTWDPVMFEGKFKGYRLEVYRGHDGTWGCMIFRGGNITPRARSSVDKPLPTLLRAKKLAKKLALRDKKRALVEK